jgi:hypothetical protein
MDQDHYAHSSYAIADVARHAGLGRLHLVASGSNRTPVLLDSFRKNAMDCRAKAESAPSDLTRKYWLDMAAQWLPKTPTSRCGGRVIPCDARP